MSHFTFASGFGNRDLMARRVVPIRGDGNCMFRSVSYCMFQTQERHTEIRLRVVERIANEWKRYKDFIVGNSSYGGVSGPEAYRQMMGRVGEYAGHVELHAVGELYPAYTFRVHRDSCSFTMDYGSGATLKHLLFSGYLDAGHYSIIEYY